MDLVATGPPHFTLHARDPNTSVAVGGGDTIFVPMTGAPFICELEDKRREPGIADLNNFHKLAHMSPGLHSTAHVICEPMDIPVGHRHLQITHSSMAHRMASGPRWHDFDEAMLRELAYDFSCTMALVNGDIDMSVSMMVRKTWNATPRNGSRKTARR